MSLLSELFQTFKSKSVLNPGVVAKAAVSRVKYNNAVSGKYDNGVALTPPMGWSSWNLFRNKINEELIFETAKALKDSGLADCGYKYVNIDDCWQSSIRDENGRLQGDFVSFPSGIKSLVERVNSLGLKLGIYSSNGTLTCEDLPASLGNEAVDADTFAEWGIEYFKYDFCHNVRISSYAPQIIGINIINPVSGEEFEFGPDDAVFSGDARISQAADNSACRYIDGLSVNMGSFELPDVNVSDAGEFILTIIFKKGGRIDKHIEILVNGSELYRTDLPATKAFTLEGRHQIRIKLLQGKNTLRFFNPVASRMDSASVQYSAMANELKRATKEYAEKNGCEEKPIVFSICEWGRNFPWKWGKSAGNMWRTTPDIRPVWSSVIGIYEFNVLLYNYAEPGAWNDPDMLEVGNGKLTFEENKSHFSLWCMMSAPLILGNDIRKFIKPDGTVDKENETYRILANKAVIAVDQDSLGIPCRRIKTNGAEDILVKPLENDEVAVCFFNKANSRTSMNCPLNDIIGKPFVSIPKADKYLLTDLWSGEEKVIYGSVEAMVPGHGVRLFRIRSL